MTSSWEGARSRAAGMPASTMCADRAAGLPLQAGAGISPLGSFAMMAAAGERAAGWRPCVLAVGWLHLEVCLLRLPELGWSACWPCWRVARLQSGDDLPVRRPCPLAAVGLVLGPCFTVQRIQHVCLQL